LELGYFPVAAERIVSAVEEWLRARALISVATLGEAEADSYNQLNFLTH